MKQRIVYTIGESILDVIFKNGQPVSAKPGGAMLNSAISLGRAGIHVSLISEFGIDKVGDIIAEFLDGAGVFTNSIYRYSNGKTALSLAFLDDQQNAQYSFYKPFPKERLICSFPKINPEDIVLFGSSYGLNADVRKNLMTFVTDAKKNGALIIYDPNFRKNQLPEFKTLRKWILENISIADIVRGSDEDFMSLFSARNIDEAFVTSQISQNKSLIYTSKNQAVKFKNKKVAISLSVPKIEPVSTIGAGDAFNAGLIYSIIKNNISRKELECLEKSLWIDILQNGIDFSVNVCMSLENYISTEFVSSLPTSKRVKY